MSTENISIQDAESLLTGALVASGASRSVASSVAAALVAAEAEGQVGHGFSRLGDYAAQVRSGKVNGQAEPTVRKTGSAALVVNDMDGFAYPALDVAIASGCDLVEETGVVSMAINRSHHCGALSVQVEKIADRGCIGIMVANAPAAIAPWGAKTPVFGTNPIAFSAPRRDGRPLVIDLSLSRVARGKVMHAKKSGEEIPLGWALDKDGRPTTDPEAALEGTMVPIGEAKGTALALIVEVLAAAVAGANTSTTISSFFTADGPPSGAGQFLLALKPRDLGNFADRLESILGLILSADGARLPGTRRADAIAQSRSEGLSVPHQYLDLARNLYQGEA